MRKLMTFSSLVLAISLLGCDGSSQLMPDGSASNGGGGGGGGGGGIANPVPDPGSPAGDTDGGPGTVSGDGGTIAGPVSFTAQVYPIFAKRTCDPCHSGGGPGKDLGGLMLDTGTMKVYRELVQEISPNAGTTRVNLKDPAKSLVLTMPLAETPPDAHPVSPFASTSDPDYQTILKWIAQGAKLN